MKREDLVEFSRHELRHYSPMGCVAMALFVGWMLELPVLAGMMIDGKGPAWLSLSIFVSAAVVPLIAFVALAVRMSGRLPKCSHCGTRLTRWLLSIAIATGNCGHCGKSIES
jgi:hypothetical protein